MCITASNYNKVALWKEKLSLLKENYLITFVENWYSDMRKTLRLCMNG